MRWLLTIVLGLLVAAAGLWLALGHKLTPADPTAASPATAVLDAVRPDQIKKLDLMTPGKPALSLSRNPDGTWSQPGNWPVRAGDVTALVDTLAGLRSRFAAVKLPENPDLKPYGLDPSQSPVTVVLQLDSRSITLRFGQAPAAGESGFGRPCYVRVDDLPEVLRLGPDVFPVVARSPETYRRRQLFPDVDRVKIAGGEPAPNPLQPPPPPAPAGRVPVLNDDVAEVKVERRVPGDSPQTLAYTLRRKEKNPPPRRDPNRPSAEATVPANDLAAAWELDADVPDPKTPKARVTVRDRVDPAKLKAVLTGVPELWVEKFVDVTPEEAGLAANPEYTLTVTRKNGQSTALRIGRVSRRTEPAVEVPDPFNPMPPPKKAAEEYRYAKLDNNPLVFEVRTDKLGDLFADPDTFRDATLARFETAEVQEVTIALKGKPPVKLVRKKGNKDADRDADKLDRWYVGDVLAETARVTELLDALAKLDAKKDAIVDNPDAAKVKELELDAGSKVTVVARAKTADGDPPAPPRTYTFVIGKDDAAAKKLAVQVEGVARVNLVDDAVFKLVDRPTLAYRSRKLFDTAEAKLAGVTVRKDGGDTFALAGRPKPDGTPGTDWKLTQPVSTDADPAKAEQLTNALAQLEATEYVDDSPKPEDLDKKYGLAKPRFAVDLGFTGPGGKPAKLEIGANREGKPEAYARLNGTGSVFAVPTTLVDSLAAGSLALLPLDLWNVPSDKVTAVEVRRGESAQNESYRLTKAGSEWKLSGPFEAAASFAELQPLVAAAAALKADRYESHAATDAGKYGFDKPALRLTVTVAESKPGAPGQPPSDTPVTRTLVVGKPTADGAATRFARLDGANAAVFVVPSGILTAADKPALAWLDRTLFAVDPEKVAKVQIAGPTPDANVTLTKDDKGAWKAEGAAFAVDRPTVDALLFAAARPPVQRLAAYGSGVNWGEYGLDKPTQTVTLTTAGDRPVSHVVKLGKTDATGERFVAADDKPAVGVVGKRAAGALAVGKLDFIDRTLLAFDPAALTGFARKKGADELELVQGTLNWDVVKPAKQKADAQTVEELAEQLGRLRATKVAAYAPTDAELDKFGLKTPAAAVALAVGDTKPVLKIGKPVDEKQPDGDRYAAAETKGPATVGVIPGFLANKLLADPLKFRDRVVAKFVDADKITLERGDRKVAFVKADGSWKVTEPDAFPAEQADLDEFVNAAAKLRADELVAEKPGDLKPYGLDKPEATWKFFENGREVLSLLVGSKEKSGPRVYAKAEKADTVALLDPVLSAKVLGEYRKREVWKDLDASGIDLLTFSQEGSNFVLQKSPAGWRDPSKPGDAIDQAKVAEVLGALPLLKAERYVADKDAKLELYGLAKPRRKIVILQRSGPKTLEIGSDVGGTNGKQVYARVAEPGRTDVFVLSEADTAKLLRDRPAFLGKK